MHLQSPCGLRLVGHKSQQIPIKTMQGSNAAICHIPNVNIISTCNIIEESFEVKLPTIWRDGKAELGRVREEKKRKDQIRRKNAFCSALPVRSKHSHEANRGPMASTIAGTWMYQAQSVSFPGGENRECSPASHGWFCILPIARRKLKKFHSANTKCPPYDTQSE